MYKLARRITQPVPHYRRYCSTWPCQSQKATGEPGSAADGRELHDPPHARGRRGVDAAGLPARPGADRRRRRGRPLSAPSSAARTARASAKSPAASSTVLAEQAVGLSGIAHEGAYLVTAAPAAPARPPSPPVPLLLSPRSSIAPTCSSRLNYDS